MRVAVPTEDETRIAPHTGRCRGFAIYVIEGEQAKKLEYRTYQSPHYAHEHGRFGEGQSGNDCTHGHHGDSGHSHRGLLDCVADCDVFLATGMGPRLVSDLQAHGLKVMFTLESDIAQAMDALARGQLVENPGGSACHRH